MSFDHSPYSLSSRKSLAVLRQQYLQLASSWAMEDYRAFVTFHTRMLPKLMNVERCTIYIIDIGSNRICSIYGTGLSETQIEAPLDGSLVGRVISTGRSLIENNLEAHSGFHEYIAEQTGYISRNMICSPIKSMSGNGVSGAIQLLNKNDNSGFGEDDLAQLEEVAHYLSISIEAIVLNKEILRIADYLDQEVDRLDQYSVRGSVFIAESPAMREVLDLVRVVGATPINVVIQGENGTGKELIARMVHEKAGLRKQPFVAVNCACIPENLVETEFFGHEKGAFTGADSPRKGRFEEAEEGTLFLDEIAEMPLQIQPKFLRAIQEGEGTRLGSSKVVKYNFRLISATNKDLSAEVKSGNFREDLFFRLFSVEILVPPLRERKEDILPLAIHFLEETNKLFSKNISGFSQEILDLFEKYSWPGNVRQLRKEVERLVALTTDGELIVPDNCSRELASFYTSGAFGAVEKGLELSIPDQVKMLEVELIERAMKKAAGNKSKAAGLLKITRQGLLKKIKRYGVELH
ncbi:sigma-54-dependent Fis family transcriptional regulator [Desulfopila inferna]|uniref:sigma-54-dependent Fis family transcriptional regulator n=1 Tax=Desulfopila inferna TaxID=468528 RepID=UPI001963A8E5|nr:sigma-54-dependent Fis family transcriptional regulator [Desulfopila inferna]MBM9603880.1 sigma-54-dependent Fis family transcriptional regulator [Desulfopila inferna]